MTRCVIYARVSTEEQAAEGKTSISTQLDDCRQLAAKLGWVVAGEFIDEKRYRVGKRMIEPSGTRADRPQWKRMLQALSDGQAEALLCWHSSRMYRAYRPMIDLLDILDAHPITVQLVKDSFDPKFAVLQAWLGREENLARNERVRFGMAGRAKKGLPPSAHSHFFRPVIELNTGEKLGYEFDEQYRPHFDALARLFLERHTYMDIAARLGTHPLNGRRWNRMTVRDIIRNPYYRGRLEFGRSVGPVRFAIPTSHKAVWDAATCSAIESELHRRTKLGGPRTGLVVFSGILHCGYCGRVMAGATSHGRTAPGGRAWRQYVCQWRYRAKYGDIDETMHPANCIVEHKVLARVADLAESLASLSPDEAAAYVAGQLPADRVDDSDTRRRLAEIETQIAEMEPELSRVKSAGARGAIDAELSRLRAEATLYREHLALAAPVAPVDYVRMTDGWARLASGPEWLDLPDGDLRILMAACFPALYIAGGEIVAPP